MIGMHYFIGYKGKCYGPAMSRSEAESKLIQLSKSFDGLEIVALPSRPSIADSNPIIISTSVKTEHPLINPIMINELPSS